MPSLSNLYPIGGPVHLSVVPPARAKALVHSGYECRSRTVAVSYDARNSNAISGFACAFCSMPQRCSAPTSSGAAHGRTANVLTSLGPRCFECAKDSGLWDERRDGFAKLICR